MFYDGSLLPHMEGHAEPYVGVIIGSAGLIALGIGAAGDTGWLAIVGGIAAAVGLVVSFAINHATVEKGGRVLPISTGQDAGHGPLYLRLSLRRR